YNSGLIIASVTLGTGGAYAARGYIYGTIERYLTHNDPLRVSIAEISRQLLWQSSGWGIGYMNFYAWYGMVTGYHAEGRTGAAIEGVNLHNSYMTWALEGGLPVCIVVGIMLWRTHRRVQV